MLRLALTGALALAAAGSLARAEQPAAAPAAPAKPAAPAAEPNTLTDQEKKDGWVLLFDGKTTAGWRKLGFDGPVPEAKWVVRDGCLVHLPSKETADIVYDKPFESFELSWEWRVPKPKGNSGIKYRVPETKGKNGAFGPEYQMMNDPGVTDKHATGSLYDLLPPKNKQLVPDGQFNVSRVVVRGDKVEHWLNGQKAVEFTFWSDEFNKAQEASKFKGSPVWAKKPLGYIALTSHGDEAHFRNVKLRVLEK
ncbi:MAG TPA: DUF1080 domain-containing protein [Humisphaera sp.]